MANGTFIDLTGKKFGRLTVIKRVKNMPTGKKLVPAWLCKCDCGKECVVRGSNLRNGGTRSCGCLNMEKLKGNKRNEKDRNEYTIDENNVVHMKITKGQEVIFDKDDLDKILQYRWVSWPWGKTEKKYYAMASRHKKNKVALRMHQLIMNAKYIDHINGNGLDNRKCNLRKYDIPEQNGANMEKYNKNTSSKYKGVFKYRKRFKVLCGKEYVGLFKDEKEAAMAYNKRATELYGEFARLNVIE